MQVPSISYMAFAISSWYSFSVASFCSLHVLLAAGYISNISHFSRVYVYPCKKQLIYGHETFSEGDVYRTLSGKG